MSLHLTYAFLITATAAFIASAAMVRAVPYAFGRYASSLVSPVKHQYHTQGELGQYAYGYNDSLSAKQEVRRSDGVIEGSYSYRDAKGVQQTVDYIADESGFHVRATNLPRSLIKEAFRPLESSNCETTPPAAGAYLEPIISDRKNGNEDYSRDRLRLAGYSAFNAISFPVPAYISVVELPKPMENSVQMATAPSIHLSGNLPHIVFMPPNTHAAPSEFVSADSSTTTQNRSN